jgi:hypothetical protein
MTTENEISRLRRKLESSTKALDEIANLESDSSGDPWATLETIGHIARNSIHYDNTTKKLTSNCDCDESVAYKAANEQLIKDVRKLKTECDKLREASTYENAGCTASAMGWAIKYFNIQELALRLIHAKGRFHTQIAFQDLREFILEEKLNQKTNE